MNRRFLALMSTVAVTVVIVLVAARVGLHSGPAPDRTPPQTPWGKPDLNGIWDFRWSTPLERPSKFADKEFFTDEEAAKYDADAKVATDRDRPERGVGDYGNEWTTEQSRTIVPTKRTSFIVDPRDGKKPPMTQEAAKRIPELLKVTGFTGDFNSYTRCISRVMPRFPQAYNSATQIVQTPDYVLFRYEQLDTRIIPLDGHPHVSQKIHQWLGDSRGHWEGNTLVVDTTNLHDKQTFQRGSQGNLHMIERYTRVDATILNYEVTLDDPTTWTRPWTLNIPWKKDDKYQMFEYACHEGNYALPVMLKADRTSRELSW